MKKLLIWSITLFVILLTSCSKDKFVIDPPIPGLETAFSEIQVNPNMDSTYVLDNDTKITIQAGSIFDSEGRPINENITIRFRQFDDAVSIFLSGLPMSYTTSNNNMILQTAGMYEIRGEYNGQSINVDPEKPISIKIGSFYEDPRQGFFKLDEETGNWDLVDIPEAKYNEEVIALRDKIANLKPEWEIPLPPNYYVFSLERMADIFLNDDWGRINRANMDAMKRKMAGYGVKALNINHYYNTVKYKGNTYQASEMLWKTSNELRIPKWAKETYGSYYDKSDNKYKEQIFLKKQKGNIYKLTVINIEKNKKWSADLELVTHLRYLTRYSPQQLIARAKEIEAEITEAEERLKTLRLIDYTTQIYDMGIYNCDRPVYFQEGKPQITFKLNGKIIPEKEIHKATIFNEDLSSYAAPASFKPITFAFFKGTNKVVLITKTGEIGLFSGEDFNQINAKQIKESMMIELEMKKVDVEDEKALRELLKK